ncbi:EamA family transporter [Salinibacterium sp. NSLL150]|uniref:EamA family transporter n=1 Tax=unclassified Salinibacterium TaxID=2632331 RepID=UPI0018CF7D41|nr:MULTISPECIES: EamA family transporter [unclassified Salinibacterium]MBH0099444.1 EamA family transporter [Salinibacterium sp. NSLL35]MBH0102198.1 EamA family transporter [Salinibacterium sp. NSLL150]MBH0104958.1 EamA family transporter [Salinibacterium sp. NSLL16]MBH0107718.1 EamA family transporter [Salinibacterium sp. NSLL17]
MRLRDTLITAIAPIAWGTTYIVTTELLPTGHPLFASLVRALPAGLIALAIARQLPHGAWWWKSLVLGVLNIGAFFPLLFIAAYRLPGGVAATLGAAQPLIVAVLIVVAFRQSAPWRLVIWGIIGALGVALVVLRASAQLDTLGLIAGLAGTASMALGVLLSKHWGKPPEVSALSYAGWLLTAGGLFLLPITLLAEGIPATLSGPAIAGYAWLGIVGGIVAYTLWFRGVRIVPISSLAVLGLLSPLTAATLGALLLGERFSAPQLLGFGLALAAIVGAQIPARTPAPIPSR